MGCRSVKIRCGQDVNYVNRAGVMAMRGIWFGLLWLFVLGVAIYDAGFAWYYRADMASWEMNPLACWMAGSFGLTAVFGFKFAALAFAAGLATYLHIRRRRLERPLTLGISGAHGALLIHYCISFLQPHGF